MTRKALRSAFRAAASKALQTRLRIGADLDKPLNPFRACESLGVEVRFIDVPSLEGMYHKGRTPTVLVCNLRPSGRKASTCGHELGHHVLGHGTRIDELRSGSSTHRTNDIEEYTADVFSSFLLMPPALMRKMMAIGFINNENPSARQLYRLSTCLDVSYSGLLTHLSENLKIIPHCTVEMLAKIKLSSIREEIVGEAATGSRVLEVDKAIPFNALFAETGDLLCLSDFSSEQLLKFCAKEQAVGRGLWRFIRAGSFQLIASPGNVLVVHIRRSDFTGRACFQYLEDPDDE